jgi:hypothetical protein
LFWSDVVFGNAQIDKYGPCHIVLGYTVLHHWKLHKDHGIVCVFID